MTSQPFTRNSRDHSNDNGYQFEFFCDKCGNGRRSTFQASGVGLAASVLKAAGSFFGGSISRAGWGADHLKDALRGPAWDAAYQRAVEECRPHFRQCTRCGQWVCPEVCWNQARGLCEQCAPDVHEQAAAIQAQVAVEQAWEKARASDQLRGVGLQKEASVGARCSKCQGALPADARFCAMCGTPAAQVSGPKFCSGCGAELPAGGRFCSRCGRAASP